MRRLVNRILSATPTLIIAVCGLYATADPSGAKHKFELASRALANEPKLIWIFAVSIFFYVILWWLSSLDPPPKRQEIVRGLQPHYESTANHIRAVQSAFTDADAQAAFDVLEREQASTCEWIAATLGTAAKEKFVSRNLGSGGYEWMWAGEHEPEMVRRRSNALNTLGDRLKNLEQLLESDRWDERTPSVWQRFGKRIKRARS